MKINNWELCWIKNCLSSKYTVHTVEFLLLSVIPILDNYRTIRLLLQAYKLNSKNWLSRFTGVSWLITTNDNQTPKMLVRENTTNRIQSWAEVLEFGHKESQGHNRSSHVNAQRWPMDEGFNRMLT